MSANQSQAYQLKAIRFHNTARNILLQNENGPCPLLAAANALLLRGVIKLDPVCVRNGVASTNDVVNMLANRALTAGNRETANQTVASDSSHHAEYHLNEVLSLLPSLQHGMDVNPKFTCGPTGVEYTNNLATFDLLGVELVHGWLLDPQDMETVSVVESKTYNELIETVIHGNDAREAVQKLEAQLCEKEKILEEDVGTECQETKTGDDHDESESMDASGTGEEESAQSNTDQEQAVQKLEAQLCEKEKIIEKDVVLDGEETKTGDDHVESESIDASGIGEEESAHSNTNQEQGSGDLPAKESSPEIPGQETKTRAEHVESESIDASGIGEEESAQSNTNQEQCSGDLSAKESSSGIPDQKDVENENVPSTEQPKKSFTGEEKVALQKEIIDMRENISELSLQITKSEVANAFLTSSGHQLTYHGLEQLHKHLGNDALCVFFRNNHFATLTKHDGVLYLLATDLGYANIPEIVWEKLDNIDGDTSYANEFFAKPTPRAELKPAAGPTIAPELMLAQRSQAETDYQLALAMSKGAANPGRMDDDDEGRLIQAAKELSLKTYHGDDDAAVIVDDNINASTSNSRTDSDLEVAMSYQRAQEQSEHESEQLARQLQELEYARQPAANPRRPARAAPAAKSASTTSNCTIS